MRSYIQQIIDHANALDQLLLDDGDRMAQAIEIDILTKSIEDLKETWIVHHAQP